MRTFISDIIPKIQLYSKKLDELTTLTNQHWVSLDDISNTKKVYIFRTNNQLLISENGVVEKARWEYIGNQSLLIDTNSQSFLLKHGFLDENIIALKLDSSDKYAFFVNENKHGSELNTLADVEHFLKTKYVTNVSQLNNLHQSPNHYEIVGNQTRSSLMLGKVEVYTIKFGKKIDYVYQEPGTERYFFLDYVAGKVYFNSLDKAINELAKNYR